MKTMAIFLRILSESARWRRLTRTIGDDLAPVATLQTRDAFIHFTINEAQTRACTVHVRFTSNMATGTCYYHVRQFSEVRAENF